MSDYGTPRPCQRCKQSFIFRTSHTKYCRACAIVADAERKAKWAAEKPHAPLTPEQMQARKERTAERIERGILQNTETAGSISWMAEDNPDLSKLVRISIPFDQGLSKNAMWSMARGANCVYMGNKHKTLRAEIEERMRLVMSATSPFVQGKVWIDVLVQKPFHRGDAINMMDAICDSVKKAIGVDDNWFSIRKLDWQIVKRDPRIYIGVGQEVTVDHIACSYCGQILPFDQFGKRKHGKLGRATVCMPCGRIDDAGRKKRRTTCTPQPPQKETQLYGQQ